MVSASDFGFITKSSEGCRFESCQHRTLFFLILSNTVLFFFLHLLHLKENNLYKIKWYNVIESELVESVNGNKH